MPAVTVLPHSLSAMLSRVVLAIGLIVPILGLSSLAHAEGPKVRLETSLGDIVLQLDEERAPLTVANFMEYVDDGFYTDTLFHRVATSQFFINTVDNRNLDHTATSAMGWGYAVFGYVIEGEQVVDQIGQTPTGPGGPFGRDVPRTPIVIKDAVRVTSDSTAAVENTVIEKTQ